MCFLEKILIPLFILTSLPMNLIIIDETPLGLNGKIDNHKNCIVAKDKLDTSCKFRDIYLEKLGN